MNPADITNEELELHLCGPDDRAEQADLFNRCFKKRLGPEELQWRYDDGPHGAAISLVARPPGAALGICGYACSPRQVSRFGASTAAVGQTGDVMTDPAWRKRGIFTSLDEACMREAKRVGWPLTIGFPNRRSAHIFLKLGWRNVGTVRPWRYFFGAGSAARAARAREGRMKALLLPLEVLRCRAGWRRLSARAAGFTTRPLAAFPSEVEALARRVEREFDFMVRRDARYLTWRFLEGPSRLHRVLGVYRGEHEFAGYAVIQVPRAGEEVGYLVDVLGADDGAVAAALRGGLEASRQAGAELVEATAIDGSRWSAELAGAGFLAPKADNHLIVIVHVHDAEHPLASSALDAASWYFTDGDRDDETMG